MPVATHNLEPSEFNDWLDSDGKLLFGKLKGVSYQVIADDNPRYLRWVLTQDVSDLDAKLIRTCLARIGQLNGGYDDN